MATVPETKVMKVKCKFLQKIYNSFLLKKMTTIVTQTMFCLIWEKLKKQCAKVLQQKPIKNCLDICLMISRVHIYFHKMVLPFEQN